MQDESRSYSHERNFSSISEKESEDIESRAEEEIKAEVVGSRTEAEGDNAEIEGRTWVEEERRREAEIGRRKKARCNDRRNNYDTS